jgi:murein DD-endopeptidase MepM/ murein hydrolase activator NlpD
MPSEKQDNMPKDPYLEDFPGEEDYPVSRKQASKTSREFIFTEESGGNPADGEDSASKKDRLMGIWEDLSQAGLAEITLRLGTHILLLALILIVAYAMRQFYQRAQVTTTLPNQAVLAAELPTATPTEAAPALPPLIAATGYDFGITRQLRLHTDIPSLPRTDVITYTVKTGDTLFGIAEKFGLKPQTILWGNYYTLADNPHTLRPGQVLNVLPVDGVYHKWSEGEGLNGVAKFYGVKPEDITNYPGNHLDPSQIGDPAHPNIKPGTWLIIPGGTRAFVSWSAPVIPRDNPKAAASVLGPGACSSPVQGAIGSGTFVWPSDQHYLSGFDYNPAANHPAIDIAGDLGKPAYASDSGVIVYAGWNNWGYGNVIVINHGNGWQTLYAHLSQINVGCGQSVVQGSVIGLIGSTGNSTGPHLHFEMMYNGVKVNPHDYLP